MKNIWQQFKDLFGFSVRERRALLLLSVVFILLLVLNLFSGYVFTSTRPLNNHLFEQAVAELALRKQSDKEAFAEVFGKPDPDVAYAQLKLTPFPFDPNQLPEEEWRKLGLATHQIRAIKNYEKKGGKFLRKEDLSKIYSLSADEYKILEPFILIEPRHQKPKHREADTVQRKSDRMEKSEFMGVLELNSADSLQLIQLKGVGPWTVHRILKYRERLGGFVHVTQLNEIKGVDSALVIAIGHQLTADTTMIRKININKYEFGQLLGHPYLNMTYTKAIVRHRERRGRFASWDEFVQIVQPDSLSAQRLRPYVAF